MKPLFLIGFPAAGKTTLGRPLAAKLRRPFIDLDEAVEALAGKSVAEIFATDGEAAFRALESEALMNATAEGAVVACGGGTPCFGANMDYMLEAGLVVELQASDEVTLRRLCLFPGHRPALDALIANPNALATKVADMRRNRAKHYARAHATFDANHLESQSEIDTAVAEFINKFSPSIF